MFQISNFTDNDDIRVLSSLGSFTVIEKVLLAPVQYTPRGCIH